MKTFKKKEKKLNILEFPEFISVVDDDVVV